MATIKVYGKEQLIIGKKDTDDSVTTHQYQGVDFMEVREGVLWLLEKKETNTGTGQGVLAIFAHGHWSRVEHVVSEGLCPKPSK